MPNEADSKLEALLAEVLLKEKIPFEQQYRIYEKPSDLIPKYTVDFLIQAGNKPIVVECDGALFHGNQQQKEKDAVRNAWLYMRGYTLIIRFDTTDIKYNINGCVNEIKKALTALTGKTYILKPENQNVAQYKSTVRRGFVANNTDTEKLNKVSIYAASHAVSYDKDSKGAIAFQLVDTVRNRRSEEFAVAYSGVNVKTCQSLAVLEALRKMKKPSELTIYTNSKWLANVCNNETLIYASQKLKDAALFRAIGKELAKHNYKFVCLVKTDGKYGNEMFRCLISRAKQMTGKMDIDEQIRYDVNAP